jgi:hypothetical protein
LRSAISVGPPFPSGARIVPRFGSAAQWALVLFGGILGAEFRQRFDAVEKRFCRTLRAIAHLDTRALLQPEQLALYRQLRGYGESKGHHRH